MKALITVKQAATAGLVSFAILIVGLLLMFAGLYVLQTSVDRVFAVVSIVFPALSALVIAWLLFYIRHIGLTLKDIGFTKLTKKLLHLIWQLPLMIVVLVLVQAIFFSLLSFETPSRSGGLNDIALQVPLAPAISIFIGVVILTPIWEEIVFRGMLFQSLKPKFKTVGAVLLTSVAFALAHILPVMLPYFITVGILFSLLYLFHKNLYASVFGHMFLNGFVGVVAILFSQVQ